MDLDQKDVVDCLVCVFILLAIIAPRFNSWTQDTRTRFTGTPSEYIDEYRYVFYCGIYISSFVVLIAILYNFPGLVKVIASTVGGEVTKNPLENILGKQSFTVMALLVATLLNHHKVNHFDELWRNRLHEWARIPKAVEEIKNQIIRNEAFLPSRKYLAIAKKELQREAGNSSRMQELTDYWVQYFDHWEEHQEQHTMNWYYTKCLCLLLVVRDTCGKYSDADLQVKEGRLKDLGKIIPFLESDDADVKEQQTELELLSNHFIECICKHLIKKYPTPEGQYNAFKNLGFNISYRDSAEVQISEAIIYCIIGVLLVSVVSAAVSLPIIKGAKYQLAMKDLIQWSAGGFISLSISIFVGMIVQKVFVAHHGEATVPVYVITLFIATLGSFIYFHIVSDAPPNLGRLFLALSFSTVAVVVMRSMNDINSDFRDVVFTALIYAVSLAVVMALLQMSVSIAFLMKKPDFELSWNILTQNDWKVTKLGLAGLFKGFVLGGMISYLIQDILRRQQLAALRCCPRINFNKIMTMISGSKSLRINTKNLSKTGMMIKCRDALTPNDQITLHSTNLGTIQGIVRWTQRGWMGRHIAGIEFTNGNSELNNYIRNNFGEFYA